MLDTTGQVHCRDLPTPWMDMCPVSTTQLLSWLGQGVTLLLGWGRCRWTLVAV